MNSRERLKLKFSGGQLESPLFCPAIYEHKAKLIGRNVSEVAQSAALLYEAVIAEYETYRPDMLTVGIDLYNIEAEAIGCKVSYPEQKDAVPVVSERILKNAGDIKKLGQVDVEDSGRMPMMLEAAEMVQERIGNEVLVRGGLMGPFSMAAELMGIEGLVMAMVTEPEAVDKLLDYCTRVSIEYGKAFIKRGLSICVFDSQATPPLISPDMYRDSVLPRVKLINKAYKDAGCEFTEYVVGGRTDAIAGYIIESGFDIVLSDFSSDASFFVKGSDKGQLIRRNISPILIENGPQEELAEQVQEIVELAQSNSNVIIGTGVLSYGMSVENILRVKRLCTGVKNGR